MTPTFLRLVADYLHKYAAAVESTLFINMKIEAAHNEIDVVKNLAATLYNEAAALEINLNK